MLKQKIYQGSIPKYFDDRTELFIHLSDVVEYRTYSQFPTPQLSIYHDLADDKWKPISKFLSVNVNPDYYDEALGYSYYKETLVEKPNFKLPDTAESGSLTQFDSTAAYLTKKTKDGKLSVVVNTSSSTFMVPNMESEKINRIDTGTEVRFPKQTFTGDSYTIQWDYENHPEIIDTYTASSIPVHNYNKYGDYVIKFSSNISQINVSSQNVFIKKFRSKTSTTKTISGFDECRQITTFQSNLSAITNYMYDCYELTSISLPNVKIINPPYALNCLYNLKTLYVPELTALNDTKGMFKGDINLQQIIMPKLVQMNNNEFPFQACLGIETVKMPKLKKAVARCFHGCANLKKIDLSSLEVLPVHFFLDCFSLDTISLPSVERIETGAFQHCLKLNLVDLSNHTSGIVKLMNINAFDACNPNYKVKVPISLYEQYKTDSVWSQISNHLIV